MDTWDVGEVQGYFGSTSGHYNPSGARKQVLRSPLVAGDAWAPSSHPGSAASPWRPPPALFPFEAWPCISLSLLFPDVPTATLALGPPFRVGSHVSLRVLLSTKLRASTTARQRRVLSTPCHRWEKEGDLCQL